MKEETVKKAVDGVKDIALAGYGDIAAPVLKPAGKLLSLPLRAVKAALLPFEKWIVTREQNLEDFINRRVPEKLRGVPEDKIKAPGAYIGVPILQNAAYCDNNELSDMYAELLAKEMYEGAKGQVHPGYVDVIRSLCPDEAKTFKYLSLLETSDESFEESVFRNKLIHIIATSEDESLSNKRIFTTAKFSFTGIFAGCEYPKNMPQYIDNLRRLGIIDVVDVDSLKETSELNLIFEDFIGSNSLYEDFYKDCGEFPELPLLKIIKEEFNLDNDVETCKTYKNVIISSFGQAFRFAALTQNF